MKQEAREYEAKEWAKEWKPADKPVVRPAKRFVKLPGDVLKRRSATLGGPVEEHTQYKRQGF